MPKGRDRKLPVNNGHPRFFYYQKIVKYNRFSYHKRPNIFNVLAITRLRVSNCSSRRLNVSYIVERNGESNFLLSKRIGNCHPDMGYYRLPEGRTFESIAGATGCKGYQARWVEP